MNIGDPLCFKFNSVAHSAKEGQNAKRAMCIDIMKGRDAKEIPKWNNRDKE
jgi:hypothetical protein